MTRPIQSRTIIIVEPHLEGRAGHSWLYARAFANRFAELGWRCQVLAHRDYDGPRTIGGAQVIPVFRRSYYEMRDRPVKLLRLARAWQRWARLACVSVGNLVARLKLLVEPPPAIGLLRRSRTVKALWRRARRSSRWLRRGLLLAGAAGAGVAVALPYGLAYAAVVAAGRPATRGTVSHFARAVKSAFDRTDTRAADVRLLVPTATPAILSELLALSTLLKQRLPRVALIFHEEPDFYREWYRPLELDALRHRLKGSGWRGELRCFATNARLARHLSDILAIEVESIGTVIEQADIVRIMEAAACQRTPEGSNAREEALFRELRARKTAGERLAICPGAMRPDKGAPYLPAMVKALAGRQSGFCLVLQAPTEPEPLRREILTLAQSPDVVVLPDDLSEADYTALLAMADVVLLPYDPAQYARRVSQVFFEAVLASRPILASAGMSAEEECGTARFLHDWSDWPTAAAALLESDDPVTPRAAARHEDAWRRWRKAADWLVEPAARVRVRRPILYVRPSWFASGSATVFDTHLRHFAERGLPVVETIIDPDCGASGRAHAWTSVLADRAASPASVTCWSTPRSGLPGLTQAFWVLLRHLRGRSYAAQMAETRRNCPLPPIVRQIARHNGFSLILVNHYFHEPFVASMRGHAPLWIETHDVQARQMVIRGARNRLTGTAEPFSQLLRDELSYLYWADVIGAINTEEVDFFRDHLGDTEGRVMLCQPAVRLPRPREVVPPCDILVVASDNSTNVMNMRWFLQEVMPLLGAVMPDVRVVGNISRIARREGLLAKNVTYTGPVSDLAAHYAATRVVALPVVAGTGIAIKALEALVAGRAIVATPLAFRGLPLDFVPPSPPTADAPLFAARIARLLEDGAALFDAARATRAAHLALGMERRYAAQMDEALDRLRAISDQMAG